MRSALSLSKRQVPSASLERELQSRGYRLVAGADEVGRGPLAGPVMAGAVVLPPGAAPPGLAGVRDSKQLTRRQRERLDQAIRAAALAVCVGEASVGEIDTLGIVPATRLAIARAVEGLGLTPAFVLIDGRGLELRDIPCRCIVKGDALCLSIAAASIVAKVARDSYMREIDSLYPGYGFARHKGYGTAGHLESLARLGPSPVHRRSFAPVHHAAVLADM
ncbi:MAG: ribonuclease HII [Chloroflexi bacterium]|nr:ribonuclease HII [Chloroflexota bacterium]